jgi:hypothetical protein
MYDYFTLFFHIKNIPAPNLARRNITTLFLSTGLVLVWAVTNGQY